MEEGDRQEHDLQLEKHGASQHAVDVNYSEIAPYLSVSVPREPVDGVGAETDDGHHADHRVRQDGTWFHELPAGRPDCLAERR